VGQDALRALVGTPERRRRSPLLCVSCYQQAVEHQDIPVDTTNTVLRVGAAIWLVRQAVTVCYDKKAPAYHYTRRGDGVETSLPRHFLQWHAALGPGRDHAYSAYQTYLQFAGSVHFLRAIGFLLNIEHTESIRYTPAETLVLADSDSDDEMRSLRATMELSPALRPFDAAATMLGEIELEAVYELTTERVKTYNVIQ